MNSQKKRILVIIVNYNQTHEVKNFLMDFPSFWPLADAVFVDDGSTDGSDQIAESLNFTVLRHPKNRGAGAAIRTGIMHALKHNYEGVSIMSSNGKMKNSEMHRIMAPVINGECDYTTGSRFIQGGSSPGLPLFRRTAIPLVSFTLSLFLRHRFTDITNGQRCYLLKFLQDSRIDIQQDWLDRYEMEYYIHYWACRLKLRIKEVAVTSRYDHLQPGRESKIKPITGWWSMLRPIILLTFRLKK
jgi:dolichol-phosphate mannosyltransferase